MQTARDIFSYRQYWAKRFGRLISQNTKIKVTEGLKFDHPVFSLEFKLNKEAKFDTFFLY